MIRRMTLVVVLATAVVVAVVGTAGATTGVDVGAQCTPTIGTSGQMFVNTTGSSVVIPYSGVITKWGFTFPSTAPFTVNLVTLRGSGSSWTVTSVTPAAPIDQNEQTLSVRIPVVLGDRIGITPVGLGCATAATDTLGEATAIGTPSVGQTYAISSTTAASSTDLSARLEPDVDGDGYGDETQDACPQSAKFQTACPTPKLAAYPLSSKRSFQAFVTTDLAGTATATGSVKLPKTKGKKAKTLNFASKSVATLPGAISKVTLKYPHALTSALKSLSPKQKLRLSVSITTPGVLSNATKKFTVKLAGTK